MLARAEEWVGKVISCVCVCDSVCVSVCLFELSTPKLAEIQSMVGGPGISIRLLGFLGAVDDEEL